MPALILKSGPDAGKRFEINSDAVVVGRGDVDCVIDDAELSRKHVTVRATSGGLEVEDLGSLNGTWFDGKRLDGATVIPDGGVIRLGGKIELLVEVAAPAPAEARTVAAPVVVPPPAPAEPAAVAEPAPPVAEPPTQAAPPPAPPEPEIVSEGPPPTNIPVKARSTSKPPPEPLPPAPPDASTVPPRRRPAPEPAPPAPPDATTVPPRRRPAPPPPSKSRRAPAGDAAAPLGAFSPPAKSGRRTVATRLVLPAFLTFLVIFATAIALIIYFAAA